MDEIYIREHRVVSKGEITTACKLLEESLRQQENKSLLNESKDVNTIVERWKTLAGLEKSNEQK